jgi:ESS family glutamate:Na+ symporter
MPTTLSLDMMQTVALAALVLFAGYGIRRRIGILDRFNIPAPVVGGFLFAAIALALRQGQVLQFEFDTRLQVPFMVAFFTAIGLGASLGLLKLGGKQVLIFWGWPPSSPPCRMPSAWAWPSSSASIPSWG